MSDYILKFWPKKEIETDKTKSIKSALAEAKVICDEIDFWGKSAYSLGSAAPEFLAPHMPKDSSYFKALAIFVNSEDYGVGLGEEDFEYFNRKNVVTVNGGDDCMGRCDKMCAVLKQATGDEYEYEFEIL